MCTMAITASAMVATVFVGNLYETKDRPVPAWAHTALLNYAARLLGYCSRCVDPPSHPTPAHAGFQPPPPSRSPLSDDAGASRRVASR